MTIFTGQRRDVAITIIIVAFYWQKGILILMCQTLTDYKRYRLNSDSSSRDSDVQDTDLYDGWWDVLDTDLYDWGWNEVWRLGTLRQERHILHHVLRPVNGVCDGVHGVQ